MLSSFFLPVTLLSVGLAIFGDDTILQGDCPFGVTNDARIMRREYECDASFLIEALHEVHDLFAIRGIKVGGRFVS